MIPANGIPAGSIHSTGHRFTNILTIKFTCTYVYKSMVVFLYILDLKLNTLSSDSTSISYLAAGFSVEGGFIYNKQPVFSLLSISAYMGRRCERLKPCKFGVAALRNSDPVNGCTACHELSSISGALLLLGHSNIKPSHIYGEPALLRHQLGQIQRKTVCII